MRRFLVGLVGAAVLIAGGPQGAGAVASGGQAAFAEWVNFGGSGFTAYMVVAMVEAGASQATVYVMADECEPPRIRKKKKRKKKGAPPSAGIVAMQCSTTDREFSVPAGELEIDPLLSSARLRTQGAGRPIDLRWTGEGRTPTAGTLVIASPDNGAAAEAVLFRDASAEGVVLGRSLSGGSGFSEDGFAMAGLIEGAGTGVFWGAELANELFRQMRAARPGS